MAKLKSRFRMKAGREKNIETLNRLELNGEEESSTDSLII